MAPQATGDSIGSAAIDARNDLVRGPKWRTRTTAARRGAAAVATFVPIVAAGALALWGLLLLLDRLGAPTWVVLLPWLVPTAVILAWVLRHPGPAIPSDDDDASWVGYSIRWVMVGPDRPRPVPVRMVTAAVLGAPLGWSFTLFLVLQLLGLL